LLRGENTKNGLFFAGYQAGFELLNVDICCVL